MTDVRAVGATDRLPWLEDEPAQPKPKKLRRAPSPNLWGLAAALLLLLVAGASYWLGTRNSAEEQPTTHKSPAVVAPLPRARAPEASEVQPTPQPQVQPAPEPEVRFAPEREVRIERPRPVKRIVVQNPAAPPEESTDEGASTSAATPSASPPAAAPAPAIERPLKPWPAWQSAGAKGRIVRVGAFGSREQAKLGWRFMVDAYPAVAHLKATVVADRNSRGRHFYRFQIGTTSQAHSEVLCQRMEKIHLSCAVVGLPWKPNGVER